MATTTEERPGEGVARRRRVLALGVAALALPACGIARVRAHPSAGAPHGEPAGALAQSAEPVPAQDDQAPPSDDAAIAGIQDTLDRQAAARAAHDRAAFVATIDQRNLTWRRIQN